MAVPLRVDSRLRKLFSGKRCVISRPLPLAGVGDDWHHLDDDEENSVYENIIPLAHSFNLLLRDAHQRTIRGKHSGDIFGQTELEPSNLAGRASRHFAEQWDVAAAYGVARLRTFILRQYYRVRPLSVLESCIQPLYFARHLTDLTLVTDCLSRDLLPALEEVGSVPEWLAASLWNECGDLFADNRHLIRASRCFEKCLSFGKHAQINSFRPHRYSSRLRRATEVAAITGKSLSEVDAQLREAEDESENWENMRIAIRNARADAFLVNGQASRARDALKPLVDIYSRRMRAGGDQIVPAGGTAQAMADLFQNYAVCLVLSGTRREREVNECMQLVHAVRKRFLVHPTRTSPVVLKVVLSRMDNKVVADQRKVIRVGIPRATMKLVDRALDRLTLLA